MPHRPKLLRNRRIESAKKKTTAASALKIMSLLPDGLISRFSFSALLLFLVLPAVLLRVPVFFFLLFPVVFDAKINASVLSAAKDFPAFRGPECRCISNLLVYIKSGRIATNPAEYMFVLSFPPLQQRQELIAAGKSRHSRSAAGQSPSTLRIAFGER